MISKFVVTILGCGRQTEEEFHWTYRAIDL